MAVHADGNWENFFSSFEIYSSHESGVIMLRSSIKFIIKYELSQITSYASSKKERGPKNFIC